MSEIKAPTKELLELHELLKAAGEHESLQDNVLVTGKQVCRGTGFDSIRGLTIMVVHGPTHWTVMWQVMIRRIDETNPLFAKKQTEFVMKELQKLVEVNEKILFDDGRIELPVTYENELNDDKDGDQQMELWATAQFNTSPELMFNFIKVLYDFPQYDINLYQDQCKQFHLEITAPQKG